MYKMVTMCSNCGTEFESKELYQVEQISIMVDKGIEPNGFHCCIGGEMGIRSFKCFRKV